MEHDPQHARDLRSTLGDAEGSPLEVECVGELAGALQRLSEGGVDVVLLDLQLPDSQGIATFERAYAFAPDVPFVVLTGRDAEEVAIATVQGGAQDHLFREEVTSAVVVRSLRYAIERHRLLSALRSLSLIDDLTGLYNQRGFTELGEQYLKLSRRNNREVTLVLLDLDRFRTINHTLGHHVGDRALLKVADILRATFRRSDILGRLHGDTFAVLALEASNESAEVLIARIRERIGDFNGGGHEKFQLSASIGMARRVGEGPDRLEDLLAEADREVGTEKGQRKVEASE